MNYLGNLGLLSGAKWYSMEATPCSLLRFFLPALLGVFCARQWRLEHTDHNWNSFHRPGAGGGLCLAKLIWGGGDVPALPGLDRALFIISGKLVGLTAGPVPPELLGWLACGAVGGVSVCAVQL